MIEHIKMDKTYVDTMYFMVYTHKTKCGYYCYHREEERVGFQASLIEGGWFYLVDGYIGNEEEFLQLKRKRIIDKL